MFFSTIAILDRSRVAESGCGEHPRHDGNIRHAHSVLHRTLGKIPQSRSGSQEIRADRQPRLAAQRFRRAALRYQRSRYIITICYYLLQF